MNEPKNNSINIPKLPTITANRNRAVSSIRTDRASTTTPKAGNVSRPEKGGAIKAPIVKISTISPNNLEKYVFLNRPLIRGREYFSNHLIILINFGKAFVSITEPIRIFLQRFGSQIVCRPTISSRVSKTVITSNTCVTPPVGKGKAASDISSKKATAKLFSLKVSSRLYRVFCFSLFSHFLSLSLNLSVFIFAPVRVFDYGLNRNNEQLRAKLYYIR